MQRRTPDGKSRAAPRWRLSRAMINRAAADLATKRLHSLEQRAQRRIHCPRWLFWVAGTAKGRICVYCAAFLGVLLVFAAAAWGPAPVTLTGRDEIPQVFAGVAGHIDVAPATYTLVFFTRDTVLRITGTMTPQSYLRFREYLAEPDELYPDHPMPRRCSRTRGRLRVYLEWDEASHDARIELHANGCQRAPR